MSPLPPSDHVVWKLAQQALTYGALLGVLYHVGLGGHAGGVDAGDAVGGALVIKELLYWLRRGAGDGGSAQ